MISAGGDDQRHHVWLSDLTVTQSNDPKAKSPGSLKAAGFSTRSIIARLLTPFSHARGLRSRAGSR